MAKIVKKTTETRDLFNQPPEDSVGNFFVKQNTVKNIATNHGGLIIDVLGLDELKSKQNLGDTFNHIILGVIHDVDEYKHYSPIKKHILDYLQKKFPYAKSSALVFEILYAPSGEGKIPLCFDMYGKFDLLKTTHTWNDVEIKNFLTKITSGDDAFQKYRIWEEELKRCLNSDFYTSSAKVSKHTTKKQLQEEKRLQDDNFPIPKQISGLPFIHTKNDVFAIKFMIGLYTAHEIDTICKKIDEKEYPYDIPQLRDMLQATLSSFRKKDYESLISSLSMDDEVIKTREWKGRLTMRLRNSMYERKISDIVYGDGDITHLPTGMRYKKEFLFNFRQNEWKQELLRRIEKGGKADKLELPEFIKEIMMETSEIEKQPPNNNNIYDGASPNTHFDDSSIQSQVQERKQTLVGILDKTQIINTIRKKHPEIFFGSDGKFDLARMKTENDFTVALNTLEKIFKREYPYNNEYLETNKYLYTLMDDLIDTREGTEGFEKATEEKKLVMKFFDDIYTSLQRNDMAQTLNDEWMDGVDFWLTATLCPIDYIYNNSTDTAISPHTLFEEWFDLRHPDENLSEPQLVKKIIGDVIKNYDYKLIEAIKKCSDPNRMFRRYKMEKLPSYETELLLQKDLIRENLLAVDIPEYLKNYTSDKPEGSGYISMDTLTKCAKQNNNLELISLIYKHGIKCVVDTFTTLIKYEDKDSSVTIDLLLAHAGLTKTTEMLKEKQKDIQSFFSFFASSISQFGYGEIISDRHGSYEHRDSLHMFFDMILGGLQNFAKEDIFYEEDFIPRFFEEYGENNPHKDMIRNNINFTIPGSRGQDFAKVLLQISPKYLSSMFVSFLSNKDPDKMISSFKKNALTDYFKQIAPQRRIQNFRVKDKKPTKIFYDKITSRNTFITKVQHKEDIATLEEVLYINEIQGVTVCPAPFQLVHSASGTTMDLPDIHGKDETALLKILDTFMDNVSEALLIQQLQEDRLLDIEITPEIIEDIRAALEEIGNNDVVLLTDRKLLQYKNHTISLGEIAIEQTYKINIIIWLSELDGTMDAVAKQVEQDRLIKKVDAQDFYGIEETEIEETPKTNISNNDMKNHPRNDGWDDLPF